MLSSERAAEVEAGLVLCVGRRGAAKGRGLFRGPQHQSDSRPDIGNQRSAVGEIEEQPGADAIVAERGFGGNATRLRHVLGESEDAEFRLERGASAQADRQHEVRYAQRQEAEALIGEHGRRIQRHADADPAG